jgi:Rha family phage regulatory protein
MRDLFPETLLVARQGDHIYTTSRKVAEHFGKLHKNVLRDIDRLLAVLPDAEFGRLNFEPSTYLNEQQKPQPEYHLTHDGFAFLAMRFTGKQAMYWQLAFLAAFRQQEADLAAANARYLAALDAIRPSLRPVVKDFEDGLPRSDTAMWLGKSPAAVTYHRSQARRLGLLPQRPHPPAVERDKFGFPLDAEVIGADRGRFWKGAAA